MGRSFLLHADYTLGIFNLERLSYERKNNMENSVQSMLFQVIADSFEILEAFCKERRNGNLQSLLRLYLLLLQLEDSFLDDARTKSVEHIHHVLPIWHGIWHVLKYHFFIWLFHD